MLTPRTRDAAWIAAHIPHQGAMCLLDAVLDWDPAHVLCRAVSHRDPALPLRRDGRLGAACGIEYAAQAIAVHGALTAPDTAGAPRPGLLVSARGVRLRVARLDDVAEPLRVLARRESGDDASLRYAFTVHAGDRLLLDGQATVVLDAAAALGTPSP